jgi:hypothetical protein
MITPIQSQIITLEMEIENVERLLTEFRDQLSEEEVEYYTKYRTDLTDQIFELLFLVGDDNDRRK